LPRRTKAGQMFDSETISSIVSKISSLPTYSDEDELMRQIVETIHGCGGFYFVGLYLVDSAGEWARLRAGTGDDSERMLSLGLKYRLSTASLVGSAALGGEIQFIDYYQGLYFGSPLLPETKWELALPLRVQGQVIGVLEVEGSEKACFGLEEAQSFQLVADEVARRLSPNWSVQ
jgi:GAF domain-containing protein